MFRTTGKMEFIIENMSSTDNDGNGLWVDGRLWVSQCEEGRRRALSSFLCRYIKCWHTGHIWTKFAFIQSSFLIFCVAFLTLWRSRYYVNLIKYYLIWQSWLTYGNWLIWPHFVYSLSLCCSFIIFCCFFVESLICFRQSSAFRIRLWLRNYTSLHSQHATTWCEFTSIASKFSKITRVPYRRQ